MASNPNSTPVSNGYDTTSGARGLVDFLGRLFHGGKSKEEFEEQRLAKLKHEEEAILAWIARDEAKAKKKEERKKEKARKKMEKAERKKAEKERKKEEKSHGKKAGQHKPEHKSAAMLNAEKDKAGNATLSEWRHNNVTKRNIEHENDMSRVANVRLNLEYEGDTIAMPVGMHGSNAQVWKAEMVVGSEYGMLLFPRDALPAMAIVCFLVALVLLVKASMVRRRRARWWRYHTGDGEMRIETPCLREKEACKVTWAEV